MARQEFKPGQVAKVNTIGSKLSTIAIRATRDRIDEESGWYLVNRDGSAGFYPGELIKDVKPLVVLDLDPNHGSDTDLDLPKNLRLASGRMPPAMSEQFVRIANQIETQLRPPKPEEPGLWAVVEADCSALPRRRWVHHEENRWIADTGQVAYWEELSRIELVREGVS